VKKREVESFPGSGKGTVSTFLAFYVPYSKMVAIVVFFCFPSNLPLVASFLNLKFKRTFSLERGNKGYRITAILELDV